MRTERDGGVGGVGEDEVGEGLVRKWAWHACAAVAEPKDVPVGGVAVGRDWFSGEFVGRGYNGREGQRGNGLGKVGGGDNLEGCVFSLGVRVVLNLAFQARCDRGAVMILR